MRYTIRLAGISSPVGDLTAGEMDGQVVLLAFGDLEGSSREVARIARVTRAAAVLPGEGHAIDRLRVELDEYFGGRRRSFTVPLRPAGTPFQLDTWNCLNAIPYGETRSYADLARAVGNPKAVRAVGSANGRNPIAIVIPCHRVIATGGGLGGYGGGLERKRQLLSLESRGSIGLTPAA